MKLRFCTGRESSFVPSGSVHRIPFTSSIGVKHLSDNINHTSLGNCSPASNSSASVIAACYTKWTKCETSGYINFTSFGQKSYLPASQELKKFQWLGWKTFTGLKAYLMQRNNTLYVLKLHIRDKHCESAVFFTLSLCVVKGAAYSSLRELHAAP